MEMALIWLGISNPHPSKIASIIGFINVILAQMISLTKNIDFDKLDLLEY